MKSVYTLALFFACFFSGKSQTGSFELKDWNDNSVFTSNKTFYHSTTNSGHHAHSFDFKNTSSVPQTYVVSRHDVRRNIVAPGDSAYAHFCVGPNCFSSETKTYSFTLAAHETIILRFELDEASLAKTSYIEYQITVPSIATEFVWLGFKYNNIVSVPENVSLNQSVSGIYPNPCSTNFNIDIHSASSEKLFLNIFNLTGEVVSNETVYLNEGKNLVTIQTDKLARGFYYLGFTHKGQAYRQSFALIK